MQKRKPRSIKQADKKASEFMRRKRAAFLPAVIACQYCNHPAPIIETDGALIVQCATCQAHYPFMQ